MSMVSWFHRFRGVNGFMVSCVSCCQWIHGFIGLWCQWFCGFIGFVVSKVSRVSWCQWFHSL